VKRCWRGGSAKARRKRKLAHQLAKALWRLKCRRKRGGIEAAVIEETAIIPWRRNEDNGKNEMAAIGERRKK